MKVTLIRTHIPEFADSLPSLTPELLAASMARYSRNNEGIENIVSKIDFDNPDKSVENIFKFVDYGHRSISDLTGGISMTMDGISQYLAFVIFQQAKTGAGQESSTRYIKASHENVIDFDLTDIPEKYKDKWTFLIEDFFNAYEEECDRLEKEAFKDPVLEKILSDDTIPIKKKERLKRNYAFDRARYFLPAALKTNMALIMSARGWADLIKYLASCPFVEAFYLANELRAKLQQVAPRLIKHTFADEAGTIQIHREMIEGETFSYYPNLTIEMTGPRTKPADKRTIAEIISDEFQGKVNRYSQVGRMIRSTPVSVHWPDVCFSEARDMNRHRTGFHYWELDQASFYLPPEIDREKYSRLMRRQSDLFRMIFSDTKTSKTSFPPVSHQYCMFFGTTSSFHRTTTLDHLIYEIELRTGLGANFKYAQLYRDAAEELFRIAPELKKHVKIGEWEPE